jgi:hypothetical protein
LAGLDPGRIRLQIVVGKGVERRWGTVLDEAWDEVMKDPPKNINIVIDDSPEDKIAREYPILQSEHYMTACGSGMTPAT